MIKHKGNQEYEGLSTDTKPVASDTAVNATFEETDTGNRYKNSGSTWTLDRSGDLTQTYDFLIYPVGSLNYKVKRGSDGEIVYTSNNASVADANGAMSYCRDNLPSTTYGSVVEFKPGLYLLQSGFTLVHDNVKFSTWRGPSNGIGNGAWIRPAGAFGCFVVNGSAGTGVSGITLKDLFFTHNLGAAYGAGTPFVRFQNQALECQVEGCYFIDSLGTGTGHSIQFQLTDSTKLQYLNKVLNCECRSMNDLVHINNTATSNGTGWMGSFEFDHITAWNTRYVIQATNGAASSTHAFNLDNIQYQYSATVAALPVGGAPIELNTNGALPYWRIGKGMLWDLPADRNYINVNANTVLDAKQLQCIRVGGSASARVMLDDLSNHSRGKFTGNGGSATYTVPHGLAPCIPERFQITPQSAKAAAAHYVSSADGTNFVLTFTSATAAGTNDVIFTWEAWLR